MYIKYIKLRNYKCFESKEVNFDNLNFIIGHNGAGKSTLIEAIIFALFGYSTQSLLSDIPTRNKSKSCSSELLIEDKNISYRIIRHYPLKLSIFKNNILLKLSTSEANQFIIDTFGSRENFFRFRLLDNSNSETNILEQGQVSLKKIIFAGTDDYFNNLRNKLTEIKALRERYNKDTVVVYKHYPSEKRLNILTTNLVDISNSLVIANKTIEDSERGVRDIQIKISENSNKIEYLKKQIENVDNYKSSFDNKLQDLQRTVERYELRHTEIQRTVGDLNKRFTEIQKNTEVIKKDKICYVCKQSVIDASDIIIEQKFKEQELQKQLETIRNEDISLCSDIPTLKDEIIKIKKQIETEKAVKLEEWRDNTITLQSIISQLKDDITIEEEILAQDKINRDKLSFDISHLQELKMKMEARLKQREFIYAENDILIAKKALEELDKMSSYYLVETVRILEPIINSILTKINFNVHFDVDNKGKFNIILTKENIQYKYKDLSCGQKLILQIAFKIALLFQQNQTGILICDEGMSSLDNENLNHILTMFEELPFELLIVIHHFNEFPDNANIINLENK